MKILLTGFTQRMVNSQKLRYDYITSVYLLKNALRLLGHEVEHRPVIYDEDLSGFDLALIGIGPPRSFTARHVVGSSYAFRNSKKVIFYCDDWSIANMGTSLRTTMKSFDKYEKWFRESLGQELSEEHSASVYTLLRELYRTDSGFSLLAPMFGWGNHKLLMEDNLPGLKLLAWDPTPLVDPLAFTPLASEYRVKRWVCATLQNHDAWVEEQKASWPVKWMGNRRKGEEYVTEATVMQEYANSWGVLCPRYNRAGSGWWRVRYQWAAMTKSILRCDIKDSCYMDDCYRLPLRSIEERDTPELEEVAKAQAAWFWNNTGKQQDLFDKLQAWLKE